jgi:hypothetical protein
MKPSWDDPVATQLTSRSIGEISQVGIKFSRVTNLSRDFALKSRDKDHPRSFTFNARSTNLLNHTNVTAVNTILSSGAVGQPVSAETARRLEFGVRFTF